MRQAAALVVILMFGSAAAAAATATATPPTGAATASSPPARRFRALWNQPWTEECQHLAPLPGGPINVSAWTGIEANAYSTSANGSVVAGPAFNGDVVATLYPQDGTGLYPFFACKGPPYTEKTCTAVNGGSPQLGNLSAHLAKWRDDVVHNFPNAGSTAVVALDWESWWPVWENNEPDNNATSYFVYGEVARRLVREKSPHLPPVALEAQAKAGWEAACQTWLVSTMQLARKLRPAITWGFYNMAGETAEGRTGGSPTLQWLWRSVDALFPSIYLSQPDLPSNLAAVTRVLTEANRVAALSTPPLPVFAYTMPEFDDDAWNHTAPESTFLDQANFHVEFNHSMIGGLILYGGSADGESAARCTAVRAYMTATFLPAISSIVHERNGATVKTDDAPAGDTLAFDLAILGRPVERRATGFLDGLGEGGGPGMGSPTVVRDFYSRYPFQVRDEHIAPLKPYGWRLSGYNRYGGVGVTNVPPFNNTPAYHRLRALGVKEVQILLQGTPFPALTPPFSNTSGSLPSDGTCSPPAGVPHHPDPLAYNCSSWVGLVRRALDLTASFEQVSFDIWNELDSITFPQFLALWRSAVTTIRAARPDRKVVGPSIGLSWYGLNGQTDPVALNQTVAFLRFGQAHDVLPDTYTWHDGLAGPSPDAPTPPAWVGNGSEVVRNVANMKKLLGRLGIAPGKMAFGVNEYMSVRQRSFHFTVFCCVSSACAVQLC